MTPPTLRRTALLCLSLLLPACEGPCPSPPTFVDVVGLHVIPYNRTAVVLGNNPAVRAADLQMRLELVERLYSASPPRRGGFAAWADCIPPTPTYTDQADSVRVTSRYDYDAQHPAGTSLNDIVRFSYGTPLPDVIQRPQPVQTFTRQSLVFTVPPARAGTQQFQVRLHLVNGEVHQGSTPAFTLQP